MEGMAAGGGGSAAKRIGHKAERRTGAGMHARARGASGAEHIEIPKLVKKGKNDPKKERQVSSVSGGRGRRREEKGGHWARPRPAAAVKKK